MELIKELASELGGRNISLVALLCAGLLVAATHYFEQQEQAVESLGKRVDRLEQRQADDEIYKGQGPRFTSIHGTALKADVKRLRAELDEHLRLRAHAGAVER